MLNTKARLPFALAAIAAPLLATPAHAGNSRSELSLELQAAMQCDTDRVLVNEVFGSLDLDGGGLEHYHPTKAHKTTHEGDGSYVMCSDTRDVAGKSVPADYYKVTTRHGFRVFQTEIGNRKSMRALKKAGKLSKL